MQLGAFSLSLAVKDLKVSCEFYAKLGFEVVGGDGEHYQVLRNDATLIGIFQGMFEANVLTFNPGWDHAQNELAPFTDVRELQIQFEAAGIEVDGSNTADKATGPAHFLVKDPDGNVILIDQHR